MYGIHNKTMYYIRRGVFNERKSLFFVLLSFCMLIIVFTLVKENFHLKNEYLRESKRYEEELDAEDVPIAHIQYEKLLRRFGENVEEMWDYVQHTFSSLKNDKEGIDSDLEYIIGLSREHLNVVRSDLNELIDADGYQEWRIKEAHDLSKLIQNRIKHIQNPNDCSSVKKIVCDLADADCGFGCQIHHVIYCLIMAYGTERMLILKTDDWKYNGEWESIFLPLSDSCKEVLISNVEEWLGTNEHNWILKLPAIAKLKARPLFLPNSIPEDLFSRISHLHGNPVVWWVGQFAKYVFRLQPNIEKFIEQKSRTIEFLHPIVGLHLRKDDINNNKNNLDNYKQAIDEFYYWLSSKKPNQKPKIYLATDDPKIVFETSRHFSDYEIITDFIVSHSAIPENRYDKSKNTSILGVISDIYFISKSDLIVGNLHSHFDRLAYELMQTYHNISAHNRIRSFNKMYYFEGDATIVKKAYMAHKVENEVNMTVGDEIVLRKNLWNGYVLGKNMRSNESGLIPFFKLENICRTEKFPDYADINN